MQLAQCNGTVDIKLNSVVYTSAKKITNSTPGNDV